MPKKTKKIGGAKRQHNNVAALHEDAPPYRVNGDAAGSRKQLKVLDTFAGAGGFSLGFELAGCRVVGGIEIDSWASQTFAYNHKDALVITQDIQLITDDELRELSRIGRPDILLGGPPCQGYSICRKNAGDPTDPRNSLFNEFLARGQGVASRIMSSWRMFRTSKTHARISGESVIGNHSNGS